LLLIGNVYALGINPDNVSEDDQYTYNYFNNILESFSNVFENLIIDNETYINQSVDIFNELDLLKNETLLYKNHNITSPVDYIVQPFYKFSKDLVYVCKLNKRLEDDLSKNTTESLIDAKATLVEINKTLISMDNILNEIDNITCLKKGNETLLFNTSNIRKIITLYNQKLFRYNIPDVEGLKIYISDSNPIIFENVSIYGVAENGNITVYIGNCTYNLTVKNNTFSMIYSFNKEGIYEIYAIQNGNKSNIIYANVSKIPTYILTDRDAYSGYVNENITIGGYVVDYYGEKVNGTIIIQNNSVPLNNGLFIYKISSNKSIKMNITLMYNGDKYHLPSEKTLPIEFLKYPTSIVISTNKYNITSGESINITGKIFGVNRTVDVYIVVNNKTYKKIKTNGNFIANISFNSSGVYEIYAVYYGNDIYEGSKSNIIEIDVEEESYLTYIIIGILVILIGVYAYKFRKNNNGDKKEVKEKSEVEKIKKKKIKTTTIPNDVAEAYKILFNRLAEKYSISKNVTPRELLKIIKNKNPKIYDDLKFVTEIHEKYVYGGLDIDKDTLNKYLQTIKKILSNIK